MSNGSSMIIDVRERRGLVAGMEWRPLASNSRKNRKAMVKASAREMGAGKVVIYESQSQVVTVGGFVNVDDDIDIDFDAGQDGSGKKAKKPSRLYSAAAAFALMIGDGSGVLLYSLGGSRSLLLAVTAGNPTLDTVVDDEEAQNIAGAYLGGQMGLEFALYTNTDFGSFGGNAQPITLDVLWEHVGARALLQSPPINLAVLITIVAAVCGVVGIGMLYNEYRATELRKQRQAELRAKDPLPKYKAALAAELKRLGVERQAFLNALDQVMRLPVTVAGWDISEIGCSAAESAAKCKYTYRRRGGTSERLLSALSHLTPLPAAEVPIDTMSFSGPIEMPFAGVDDREELVKDGDFLTQVLPVWQHWANAGISPASLGNRLNPWPAAANVDVTKLPPGVAVRRSEVSVDVPLGLEREIVNSAPRSVWWNEFVFSVSADGSVQLTLKGNSYVN